MNKFFVGGLSFQTTDESFGQFFSKYGEVVSAEVMKRAGQSRGFGFITFVNGDAALAAGLLHPEGKMLDGRNVEVKPAVAPSQIQPTPASHGHGHGPESYPGHASLHAAPTGARTIHAFNIHMFTTNETLLAHFNKFGAVANIIRETPTAAVIEFHSPDHADNACYVVPHNIDSNEVLVRKGESHAYNAPAQIPAVSGGPIRERRQAATPFVPYQSRPGGPEFVLDTSTRSTDDADPACKIFVGGLQDLTNSNALYHHFAKYGSVQAAEVKARGGQSRRFGFVVFTDSTGAFNALNNRHEIEGKQVDVKPVSANPPKK